MSRKIKLVASDLDGTLLLNGAQSLQPGTCQLIHRLCQKGVIFLAASGRQYANLQRLFAPVRQEIGYMCENGCLSFLEGEMIYQETMSRELGQDIMRAIWEREGCEILLSGIHTSYLQPKKMSYYYHMRNVVKNNVTLVPDIFQVEEEYMKISVYEEAGVGTSAGYWQERFGKRATTVLSGNEWLDLMPLGVNKGLGMKKIMEFLNVAPDECIALGDNYNDIEMLELVGHPIAMQNAVPEVKKICEYETDTVEHVLEALLTRL